MIEFKNITKKYRSKTVINSFSLEIEAGQLVVFIGPSGCGKTTLLKMINKLIQPTSGQIFVNGSDITEMDPIELRRNIGYVIQNTGLFPHMTIKENLELIPKLKGEDPRLIEKKTNELLEMVGLDPKEYLNRYPKELSGGQQQRVGVARAFSTNSDIILMDEPFSALDPVTRSSLQDELFQMQKELNKTIIFVTHDMDEAIKIADKICILKDGDILQYDTPENILKNPANEFVAEFIGKRRVWNNPELLLAEDIMISNPVKITTRRTVLQAIEIMKEHKVDSLMVTDKNNILLGLVTLKGIQLLNRNLSIEEVMEHNVLSVSEGTNLISVLATMNEHQIGYVPVVNQMNKLTGLITRSSILSALSSQLIDMEVAF
ncbi:MULTISPECIES: ABC transporter ATP-binding protein [Neobacillus]|uniref:Quaternary amine transport ATP-binding protein n=1 Tax=Neobacillus thermocopriae TaxID=1215031 RepID=A0A6B3TUG1_9BACI|nr:ABC transporter ATP-binding protein [Neobacillus thermocopriae]MED3625317.1 ABC transporter ATP-binding protein [Neobacillus thermocopriae]MED3715621.1 ABC transporter ATP-binding protein [Neobacillus thermocopriae]NEX80098.1 betaine/proline/choline family ABC transporter ATP-binding protein [Neobacillus thermocopriae]